MPSMSRIGLIFTLTIPFTADSACGDSASNCSASGRIQRYFPPDEPGQSFFRAQSQFLGG
jgi:hypothetical protein